jgi:hypothetical protein
MRHEPCTWRAVGVTYRRGRYEPEPGPEKQGAYEVTDEEFYRDFRDVANLVGDRPIVRQTKENTSRIRSLDLKFYAILAGVISAQVIQVLIRWKPS